MAAFLKYTHSLLLPDDDDDEREGKASFLLWEDDSQIFGLSLLFISGFLVLDVLSKISPATFDNLSFV